MVAGIKGRFHQYYTAGCYADCERWQQDYKNCLQFRNTGDISAAVCLHPSFSVLLTCVKMKISSVLTKLCTL